MGRSAFLDRTQRMWSWIFQDISCRSRNRKAKTSPQMTLISTDLHGSKSPIGPFEHAGQSDPCSSMVRFAFWSKALLTTKGCFRVSGDEEAQGWNSFLRTEWRS